jgi:nucleotide-binding universal stress UspA family protein
VAEQYLESVAEGLRAQGMTVSTTTAATFNLPVTIDDIARVYNVDMIACATHSRGTIGALGHGSVAWKVVSDSPVPVLLRHPPEHGEQPAPDQRQLLVPLDGSSLGEEAVPLAYQLAVEWHAPLILIRVIPDFPPDGISHEEQQQEAESYLAGVAAKITVEVERHVLTGYPVESLAGFVQGAPVTDIVMASHGRTGLARMRMGSVTADVIHHVTVPVIVVPAFAREMEQQKSEHEAEQSAPTTP